MDFTVDAPIQKIDEDKRLAFGWVLMIVDDDGSYLVDKQGDKIDDVWELEQAAYRYMTTSRDGGVSHARTGVSRMVESFVVTPEKLMKMGLPPDAVPPGWWVGFEFTDPEVWQGVKNGTYSMFSIHGTGVRTDA